MIPDETFLKRTKTIFANLKRRAKADFQVLDFDRDAFREFVANHNSCEYDGLPVDGATFQIDHRTPTSRAANHTLKNLAVACARCNQIKGKLTEQEARQLFQLIREWPPVAAADVLARLRAGASTVAGKRFRPKSGGGPDQNPGSSP
jgi:hypothetical protein